MATKHIITVDGLLYYHQGLKDIFADKDAYDATASTVSSHTAAIASNAEAISGLGARMTAVESNYTSLSSTVSQKADKATTLSGYGITNAYTKTQTDAAISSAIASLDTGVISVNSKSGVVTLSAADVNAYSTSEVDTMMSNKQDKLTIDSVLSTTSTNPAQNKVITAAINSKADKSTTLSGYGITNAYTKTETDTAISNAVNALDIGVVSVNSKTGAVTLSAADVSAYTKGETDSLLSGKADTSAVPTAVSDLANDLNYVVASTLNLYAPLASPSLTGTPTATTPSTADKSTRIATTAFVDAAITSAISGITGFEFQIVASLPATGEKGVIYLVANSAASPNAYDEYIWIDTKYEKIGTTDIDLSNYWSKSELVEATTSQIDTILAS